jgi:hypothetical protein
MMTLRGRCRVSKRKPENPLRLEIAPGVVAAHAGQTVIILEPIDGSRVRVRDVATGTEQTVPICELSGAALGLSSKDTRRRWEQVRTTTRKEWLRARRRERVVMRLIRGDGEAAKQIASASRALKLSRSSVYRDGIAGRVAANPARELMSFFRKLTLGRVGFSGDSE